MSKPQGSATNRHGRAAERQREVTELKEQMVGDDIPYNWKLWGKTGLEGRRLRNVFSMCVLDAPGECLGAGATGELQERRSGEFCWLGAFLPPFFIERSVATMVCFKTTGIKYLRRKKSVHNCGCSIRLRVSTPLNADLKL